MALVAVALLGGEHRGRDPRPALVLPPAEAAGHRHDVRVAELLQRLRRERGAGAARAVDDDLAVALGELVLDLALEVAARDEHGAGDDAGSYSSCSRTSRNVAVPSFASASAGVDLADLGFRLGEQLAERGHSGDSGIRGAAIERRVKSYRPGRIFPTRRQRRRRTTLRPVPHVPVTRAQSGHDPGDEGREDVAEGGVADGVGVAVERGLLGVHDHEPGAVWRARSRAARRPGRRRATCRARGTRRSAAAACCARSRSSATRFSPKLIVADFRIPPHSRHAGSSSPARTRSSVSAIGPRQPHAMHLASRTLPWISTSDSGSLPAAWCRPSMFWVTRVCTFATALELGDGAVPGVRLRVPHLATAAGSATRAAAPRDRHVVLQRRGLLGRGVLRPHAVRPAEVGDARLGGDARAGEDHDRTRVAQPPGDRVERVGAGLGLGGHARRVPNARAVITGSEGNGWGGRQGREGREVRRAAPPATQAAVSRLGSGRRRRRRPRTRRGGARTPTPRSPDRSWGGSRCRATRARRWPRSSPCSKSMKASRRARVRACSSGVVARRSSSQASWACCSDSGRRWTWRRFTGGTVRRTA